MSFWSWMKEAYPIKVVEWFKGRPRNFIMYWVGMMTSCIAFSIGFTLIFPFPRSGYTIDIVGGLLFLLLASGGFILANYGWYRQYGP